MAAKTMKGRSDAPFHIQEGERFRFDDLLRIVRAQVGARAVVTLQPAFDNMQPVLPEADFDLVVFAKAKPARIHIDIRHAIPGSRITVLTGAVTVQQPSLKRAAELAASITQVLEGSTLR